MPKLGIMASPRCKTRLCTYIGRRMYNKYVDDALATVPPVDLLTPAEARKKGVTQMTGFYNFATKRIGLVVDESKPVKVEMVRLDGITVHEYGHDLFNVWPEGEDSIGHFLDNVFTDASNEQRIILEFPWGRDRLRKLRLALLQEYLAKPQMYRGDQEPFYNAAWLTLAAHTVLSVEKRKRGKPTALELLYRGKVNAAEVWAGIEAVIGPPDDVIKDKWLEAFQVAVSAWIERTADLMEARRKEFRALFPEPKQPPMPSIFDVGGHEGDGRGDGPLAPATKPGGKPKPPSEPKDGEGDDEAPPPIEIEVPKSIDDDEEAREDSTAPEDDDKAIQDEINALNRRAVKYCPTAPDTDQWGDGERVEPVDPAHAPDNNNRLGDVLSPAENPAGQLAAQLQLTQEPDVLEHDEYGRVDTRIIATEPDAEEPFLSRHADEENSALDSYMVMMLDTSSSTFSGTPTKWESIRHAGMVFHRACELSHSAYSLVTSRTLKLLAGYGFGLAPGATDLGDTNTWVPFKVDPVAAPGLIAHLKQAVDSGDNFDKTISITLEAMALRPEPAKGLIIVTDGGVNEEEMRKDLATAESNGIITIGVGLDLHECEQEAMLRIFGPERCVLATSNDFVGPLAQTVVAAVKLSQTFARHRLVYS
jgi:hypothetical protein